MSHATEQSSRSSTTDDLWSLNMAALALFSRPIAAILKSNIKPGIYTEFKIEEEAIHATPSPQHNPRHLPTLIDDRKSNPPDRDAVATVLYGVGNGIYINHCLSQQRPILVIEPEAHLIDWLLAKYNWSQAIATGLLQITIANRSTPTLANIALQNSSIQLINFKSRWPGRVEVVHSGSYSLHQVFFNSLSGALQNWIEENEPSLLNLLHVESKDSTEALETEKGQNAQKQHDLVIISPRCAIFNDLAYSFQTLGLDTFLVTTMDGDTNSPDYQDKVCKVLQENPAKLMISRNRSGFENSQPVKQRPIEERIESSVLHWWWDTPNIATMIELENTKLRFPHLAFARELLNLLPAGSQWLPAGAQQRFCKPAYVKQIERNHSIPISFVGQSRVELLINNVSTLFNTLAELIDPRYLTLIQEFNALSGLPAIYQFLTNQERLLSGTFNELEKQWPKEVYYLRYIMQMAVTSAFRLAAIQTLIAKRSDIVVYGDQGWVSHNIIPKHHFKGSIKSEYLPELYRQSKINLNLNFMQVSSAMNPKVLDIVACGGIALSDYRPEVDYLFPDRSQRPFTFDTLEELPSMVEHILALNLDEYRHTLANYTQNRHSMMQRAEWITNRFNLF